MTGSERHERPRILLVDDDRELAEMLGEYLAREGYRTTAAGSIADGLVAVRAEAPSLIVLDVMLPDGSGFELLRELRASAVRVPIVMLTARGDDVDRILGLEEGADDYLAKPFNPRELTARIRAVLRRSAAPPAPEARTLRVGRVELDERRRRVTVDGQPIELTGAEYGVLRELLLRPGRVISRADLTARGLGRPLASYDRSIDTHVSNLRRKLASGGRAGVVVRSIRAAGYVLTVEPAEEA